MQIEDIFGIKIYEPDEKLIQQTDTIIITSRIYGEEIKQELIEKYHFRGRIFDLYELNINSTDINKWIKENNLSPI